MPRGYTGSSRNSRGFLETALFLINLESLEDRAITQCDIKLGNDLFFDGRFDRFVAEAGCFQVLEHGKFTRLFPKVFDEAHDPGASEGI